MNIAAKYATRLIKQILTIGLLSFLCIAADTVRINFDELLDKTPYAQMLKELICMTDSIGLLKHRMDIDERRFIEDSILGKMVRASRLLKQIDAERLPAEDIAYLYYWLDLAKHVDLPSMLYDEVKSLEHEIDAYFS